MLICKYPDPQTLEDVGIGGIIDFLVPELNDIYSGWIPKLPWQDNCRKRIIEDMNVYLAIIKMFITYLQENRGLTFDNRTVLHSSANERYGCWSKMPNEKIYIQIDSLWEKK